MLTSNCICMRKSQICIPPPHQICSHSQPLTPQTSARVLLYIHNSSSEMESDKGSPQALIRIRTNFQSIDGPLPKFGFSGSFRNGPANTITRGHKSILRNYDSHREGQATLITIEATRGFYQQSQWLVQKYEV